MYAEQIKQWVAQNRDGILQLNRSLVSIPSVNRYPNGDEANVQQFVHSYLQSLGCETDMFLPTDVPGLTEHPAYLGQRNYENRPNVVGRKKGSGGGRSILFSGHVDTVPIGNDPWTADPFAGEIKGDKQYGLGIYDMKGGMAAAMSALRALNELGIRLKGDVLIETVVDEEYGGANGTLACRLRGYEADIAVVPEPTNLAICPQNRGGGMYRITFTGRSGRSFGGETLVNPVVAAGAFIRCIEEYRKYHEAKPAPPLFQEVPAPPVVIQSIRAGDVTLPLQDRVPSECQLDVWIECYPGTTEDELFDDFVGFCNRYAAQDDVLRSATFTYEKLVRFLHGSGIPDGHPFVETAQRAARQIVPEGLPVHGAPLACDAFMFNLYSNTPALIWGPKGGNAHSADEFIEIEPFLQLVGMYALAMIEWCGVAE